MDIKELKKSLNVADSLEKDKLDEISTQVIKGYELDLDSKSEWQEVVDKAVDIAKQKIDKKNHPWEDASNVKYPLMPQACIDFASRMLPQILQDAKIVKPKVIGTDVDFSKLKRGKRTSDCMSYQLLDESNTWEKDTDQLLQCLPLYGTVFRKVYFDSILKKPCSELCLPNDIIVNYNTPSLERARRVTHILNMSLNDIIERMRSGIYCDIDVEDLSLDPSDKDQDDPMHKIIEQHCYLDLDDDGYKEPYIVTIHKQSKQVLRIVNRFKDIQKNKKGEILKIEARCYFVDYHYIPSPDGGFYSLGFGTLLYPINEATNTLYNNLIDAGTLSNMPCGFISSQLKLANKDYAFKPGEMKVVQHNSAMRVQDGYSMLPIKEPSAVLFNLLTTLLESGKDLSSINDALMGKQAMTHVPATTMLTQVEQGLRVFNAIHKRVFRSLKNEFRKIFDLNYYYLTDKEYQNILDIPGISVEEDFNGVDVDVVPVMDPTMSSQAQRIIQAEAVRQLPGVDPYVANRFYLEALDIPEDQINLLLPPPDPNAPPPPEAVKLMAEADKLQSESVKLQAEAQNLMEGNFIEAQKVAITKQDSDARTMETVARIKKMSEDSQLSYLKADHEADVKEHDALMKEMAEYNKKVAKETELVLKAREMQIAANESND